eukprot:Sdes_comp15629_c0_seq1m4621
MLTTEEKRCAPQRKILQIIGENYEFVSNMPDELSKWGISEAGFDYHLMAILGCQSSGKSTLLNLLFGTEFQEMNEELGRQQTTQGVWLSKATESNTLVLDVEGTDSKERGEEHINFERKSALFSLVVSEVLIINMWCADVGRYQASNYGLLKTVFDIHLQLFQQKESPKTLLLFILRDHTQKTSLERLSEILSHDLTLIWNELKKPQDFETSSLTDFFDLQFISLPHKDLQPDEFLHKVLQLKSRVNDPSHSEFIFKEVYHKQIPADGIANFCSSVWDQIIHNQDIDIPTQKEMLAMYRCDEISEVSFQEFEAEWLQPLKGRILKDFEVVEGFAEDADEILEKILGHFDLPAKRYHSGV